MDNLQSYISLQAEYLSANSASAEEVLLFNPQTNRGFAVFGVAKLLLKYLDGKATLEEIIARFAQDYEVSPEQYLSEIIHFIEELEREELILISPTPAADAKIP
jgi:hypothetical protein